MTREIDSTNDEPAAVVDRPLPIPALKVRGYRNLDDLQIGQLSRVNLVTGKNNVGKSSLLEAIHLLASRGADRAFMDILTPRGENKHERPKVVNALMGGLPYQRDMAWALARAMFLTEYEVEPPHRSGFLISVPQSGRWLYVRFGWYRDIVSEDGTKRSRQFLPLPEDDTGVGVEVAFGKRPGRIISIAPSSVEEEDLNQYVARDLTIGAEKFDIPDQEIERRTPHSTSRFFPPSGLDPSLLAQLWNEIVLSPAEDLVVSALRLIEPRVDRCALIGDPPIPHLLLRGMKHPLPLGAMGDGMGRLFNLAVVLTASRGGVVGIDEIDTGLHYSVLTEMWQFVFAVSKQLNVQVFATTHGRECIEAFQSALEGSDGSAGQVIKLFRSRVPPHKVEAATFGVDRLALALSSELEVR